MTNRTETKKATFAGGCFWCVEAALKEVAGVLEVTSGFAGGNVPDPSYKEVCAGGTGHAESVQVVYDPERISYENLLAVFFAVHNPTTRDRQGPDVGHHYRSAVFYHDEEQKRAVEDAIEELEAEGVYEDSIVTEVSPLEAFYPAEDYHQDYYEKNPNQPYCATYIPPKLEKIRNKFSDRIKSPSR